MSRKYEKYELAFDLNLSDFNHSKITVGEYEQKFDEIVDEIRADEKLEQYDKIKEVLSELENQRDRFNKLGLKGEVIGCVSAIEIIRNAFNQIVKEV